MSNKQRAKWFWRAILLGFVAASLGGCALSPFQSFGLFHFIDVAWHWLVAALNVVIVAGFGVLGFLYSPWFKEVFLGIVIGAVSLAALNMDIVNFSKMLQPAEVNCVNPSVDPNGPTSRCWHSTDSTRGYGYWGACDGQQ